MRILIEGKNHKNYLAKCHEAFRTGLRATFDTRLFGKGYPGYWPFMKTYAQIIKKTFQDSQPDLLIAHSHFPSDPKGFKYEGISEVKAIKTFILGDYWEVSGHYKQQFIEYVNQNKIDFILSYYIQPMEIWKGTSIADRFIYLPPTFDPVIFNDWHISKQYDVGFLAAGTTNYTDFYPERFAIHQMLLKKTGIRYLWSEHPGWKERKSHPLIGVNFSKAINSCKIFITTGGIYKNAQPKIFEALASKVLLMSDEPLGSKEIGLQDGFNYVKISENDVMSKVDYYLTHPDQCEEIAEAGYQLALRKHSCYVRAIDFYKQIRIKLGIDTNKAETNYNCE
jgi:hypothetical protein